MQVQLILAFALMSLNVSAKSEKEMSELFQKYEQIMVDKKTDLSSEVFTQNFLKESGGQKSFADDVKALKSEKKKRELTWKKGAKDEIWFAKYGGHSQFIIKEENKKLKIDGTVSDDN